MDQTGANVQWSLSKKRTFLVLKHSDSELTDNHAAYPDYFRQTEASWGASNGVSPWQELATIKCLMHSTSIALILCSPRNILSLILMTRFTMVMYLRERGG